MDVDALALIFFHDSFLDHGIERSKEGLMADEEMRFAAQMMEHASHFNSDVASTYKDNTLREFLEIEEAVGGYTEITTGNIRDVRVAACGEEDLLRTDRLFSSITKIYLDFILRKEVGATMEVFYFVVYQVLFIYAVQTSNVCVTLVLESCEVEWRCLFDVEPIRSSFVQRLSNSCGVPGDFLGDTAVLNQTLSIPNARPLSLYPTFTQVPPSRLLSTAIVFAPCCPLALLAQARPPLPPPMTRKSHSLLMGAMISREVENWRETAVSLETADAAERLLIAQKRIEGDSVSVIQAALNYIENKKQ